VVQTQTGVATVYQSFRRCHIQWFQQDTQGKIINLSQEEELVAKKVGRVNRAVMGCAPKPKFSGFEDPSDVLFPKFARLWVALQGMQHYYLSDYKSRLVMVE